METALPLLDHGVIPVEQLIAGESTLTDAGKAFDHAASQGVLKILLHM